MKTFIFATVSGLALLVAQGVVAKEDAAAPSTTMEKKASVSKKQAPSKTKRKHQKHHVKTTHRVQGGDVYVAFPPIRDCGCEICAKDDVPQYYAGRQDCPYISHGGYFWYPDTQGTMLKGYTPYHAEGKYWYASRLHPHTVYVEGSSMAYTYPYPLHTPNPMDDELYEMQTSPMAKKWGTAPDKQGAAAE